MKFNTVSTTGSPRRSVMLSNRLLLSYWKILFIALVIIGGSLPVSADPSVEPVEPPFDETQEPSPEDEPIDPATSPADILDEYLDCYDHSTGDWLEEICGECPPELPLNMYEPEEESYEEPCIDPNPPGGM